MERNEIIGLLILAAAMALVLPMLAQAEIFFYNNISDSEIITGNQINISGMLYNITGIEKICTISMDNRLCQKRIFVERIGMNGVLENKIIEAETILSEEENYTILLEKTLNQTISNKQSLSQRLSEIGIEMGILKEQNATVSENIQKVLESRTSLEKQMEGKFLLSKRETTLLLMALSILLIAVIIMEIKAYYRK